MMWTVEERNNFAKLLGVTAKLYDKILDFDVCKLIVDDLQDLEFQQCMDALVKFRRDSKNKFWPKASDIRAIVSPSIDKRAVAIELAYKIDKAVAKHGWNWEGGFFTDQGNYWNDSAGNVFSSFKDAVISELGEIGWHAVCSRGGWLRVRESANEMEEGQFIAQMRDQIQSTIALKEQGVDVARIEMPKREELSGGLQRLDNDTLKMIRSIDWKKNE